MLRLLADENFNGDVIRGLRARSPQLDIVRVQDVALAGAEDPQVLLWAAEHGRIVLTHDRATMSTHAYQRVAAGEMMPGVFIVGLRLPVSLVIEQILMVDACSEQPEWTGCVLHLPI